MYVHVKFLPLLFYNFLPVIPGKEILKSHPFVWLQIVNMITDELSPAVWLNAKQERNYSFGEHTKL